jgi:hypothetical protein
MECCEVSLGIDRNFQGWCDDVRVLDADKSKGYVALEAQCLLAGAVQRCAISKGDSCLEIQVHVFAPSVDRGS